MIQKEKSKEETVSDIDISFTLPKTPAILDDWIFEKEHKRGRRGNKI